MTFASMNPQIVYEYQYETKFTFTNNDYNVLMYLHNDPLYSYLADEHCDKYKERNGFDLQHTIQELVKTITDNSKLTTKSRSLQMAQKSYDIMKSNIPAIYAPGTTMTLRLYRDLIMRDRNSGMYYDLFTENGIRFGFQKSSKEKREVIREDVLSNCQKDEKTKE
jgi:hypothetical protein